MLADVLPLLRCPFCCRSLEAVAASVVCPTGHSFDIARQGYLSLLPGNAQLGSADTAGMVAARERFLAAGHFDLLADTLASEAERALEGGPGGAVLDLGAGTGFNLSRVLERLPGRAGLALDLSKHALRRAARAHEGIAAVAADAWRPLPVRDAVAALALDVFAPRNGAELARVLRPGGALIVAVPTGRHLIELVDGLGLLSVDERKQERLAAQLDPYFGPAGLTVLEWTLELEPAAVRDLVAMGPSASRAPRAVSDPMTVTASVEVSVRRRPVSLPIPSG